MPTFLLTSLSLLASHDILLWKGEDMSHSWHTKNDPVMGGQSYSKVEIQNDVLNFTGACKIVPSLKAPGFITVQNVDNNPWPDIRTCKGLEIRSRSYTSYKGFRISFGNAHAPGGSFFAYGYKAGFSPPMKEFGSFKVPFSNFTDFWDGATGLPIHTCQENPKYCPDDKTLSNIKTLAIWGEGVEGDVHLEVEAISGYSCGK